MRMLRWWATGGLLLSGWLLFQKATGAITYLVGCGADSGCANVLGSRWSQWFSVPVSLFSLLLYAAVVWLTFRPQRTALIATGTCLAGAAVWFGLLQALVIKSFCPWCLAAHAVGVICAALIVCFLKKETRDRSPWPGLLTGLAALVLLMAGQVLGPVPETHEESTAVLTETSSAEPSGPVHSRGDGRKVTFLEGKQYHVASLPHAGHPAAPHVLVKYYDYACDSCQNLHEDLDSLQRLHPGKFCIILLPCPIDRSCNMHVPEHLDDHPNSCELARIALASWRHDPASFQKVHNLLFERPLLQPAQALQKANALMKSPIASENLHDAWVDQMLAASAEDYRRLNVTNSGALNYLMPKLLVGGTRMLHGVTKDRQTLFSALEQEFKISPAPAER